MLSAKCWPQVFGECGPLMASFIFIFFLLFFLAEFHHTIGQYRIIQLEALQYILEKT